MNKDVFDLDNICFKPQPKWKFWLARLFGKRCDDQGCFYAWKGALWCVKDYKESQQTDSKEV